LGVTNSPGGYNAVSSGYEGSTMKFSIECEREEDGRWLAEVPQLPGVLAYGNTSDEALAKAEVLALRVLAERLEHGEARPVDISITLAAA
jgi:predicted RNase H-like HicB family nuclease